jgi:branched-chain amino acid transport system permease protein
MIVKIIKIARKRFARLTNDIRALFMLDGMQAILPGPQEKVSPSQSSISRSIGIALLAVVIALLSLVANAFYLKFLVKVMVYAVLAMSLDLLVGIGGMISMGHAAFFGIGAYVAYFVSQQYGSANLWLVIAVTVLAGTLSATLAVPVIIRLRGIKFVLMTLALSQIAFFLVFNLSYFGGTDGVYIYSRPILSFGVFEISFESQQNFYLLVWAFLFSTLLLLLKIRRSPFGLILLAIKANEDRVMALGYQTEVYKAIAFILSANLACLAGMLDAYNYGFANPEMLNWHTSGDILLMVIVGGIGTTFGPAFGSLVVHGGQLLLSDLTSYWLLVYGLLLIGAVFVFPNGLSGLWAFVRLSLRGTGS